MQQSSTFFLTAEFFFWRHHIIPLESCQAEQTFVIKAADPPEPKKKLQKNT